jgi:hypothetical protein
VTSVKTFRSASNSPELSTTSLRTALHFDASLTSAYICVGGDRVDFDPNTRDFNEPGWPWGRKGAASKYKDILGIIYPILGISLQ